MSRVSVTGTKAVMPEVIEAVHELNLLHLEDYDGSWEGFTPGDPIERAESASERLVTVRAIESILDLDAEDGGPPREVTEADIEERLEDVRAEVNALDDRRSDLRDDLRRIDDRLESAAPFIDLGIDLDLLRDYDRVTVRVGEGDPDAVEAAIDGLEGPVGTFAGESAVAVVAAADAAVVDEALVGTGFTGVDVPEAHGAPAEYVAELESERRRVESELDDVEDQLEELSHETGWFLLAAEEQLSIEVQKTEAPLQFATTENAFVAEGWVPTDRYAELADRLDELVGDHVDVEELERADFEPPDHGDGHGEAVADGGESTAMGGGPPVIQDNPAPVRPFELLVRTISRPSYWEIDPTVVLFLTFPIFFGFMIGDLGYGLLYVAIGYWLWSAFDSEAIRSLGGIALWAGGFTAVFGILYGEVFGLHLISDYLWEGALGMHGAPIEKGLSPAGAEFARAWLVVVILVGLAHVSAGYVLDFVGRWRGHGIREAVLESGSWMGLMLGVWIWIFSRSLSSMKPAFLFSAFDGHPFGLGFAGFSPDIGLAGLGLGAAGFVLLLYAEGGIGLLESLNVLVNVLSYARIAAVLLAKAGMAFVVNLLFFGVYAEGDPAAYHFMISYGPTYVAEHTPEAEVLFPGLIHSGVVGVLAGVVVLVLGHLVVLGLGVTSAGLQAVRLEYVEFFSKFYYEGDPGEPYEPFGYERTHTVAGESA